MTTKDGLLLTKRLCFDLYQSLRGPLIYIVFLVGTWLVVLYYLPFFGCIDDMDLCTLFGLLH